MILFLDTNEITKPRVSASTSYEDCGIYSHEDSVSGQSRLRLPHGSPRDVCPPALCPSRSTLSRLLSWCWDKTVRIPLLVVGETEASKSGELRKRDVTGVWYTHRKLLKLKTDFSYERGTDSLRVHRNWQWWRPTGPTHPSFHQVSFLIGSQNRDLLTWDRSCFYHLVAQNL